MGSSTCASTASSSSRTTTTSSSTRRRTSIVRIDEVAVGDPIDFSLRCVETHLPQMLRNAGAESLAAEVEGDMDAVSAAVGKVRELMERARRPAEPVA